MLQSMKNLENYKKILFFSHSFHNFYTKWYRYLHVLKYMYEARYVSYEKNGIRTNITVFSLISD